MVCLRLCLVLLVAGALGCNPRERAAAAYYAGPTGMAVAGVEFNRLFVANRGTDSVQVVALTERFDRLDFVRAPARYFPLNIVVGVEPTLLAAGADGRYVFALDGVTGLVKAIDAEALALVGDAHLAFANDHNAPPASIVGDPTKNVLGTNAEAKTAALARAYVALPDAQQVVVIVLRRATDGTLAITQEGAIALPGEPAAMGISADGNALFVGDRASAQIWRVRDPAGTATLLAGAQAAQVDAFAVGERPGAIAVLPHAVAIARPRLADVLVLTPTSPDATVSQPGGLQVVDANPTFTPTPACLQNCTVPNVNACQGAHPADAALCLNGGSYGTAHDANGYMAVWTGSATRALVAYDANLAGGFRQYCVGGTQSQQIGTAFIAAQIDGSVQMIALDANGGARLVDAAYCQQPQLSKVSISVADPCLLLKPCENLSDRARFACATSQGATQDLTQAAGAVVLRGSRDYRVGLAWEGVLPNGDGLDRGAQVDAHGRLVRFTRDALDFNNIALLTARSVDADGQITHYGDVVEILSPIADAPECREQLTTGAEPCAMQRRVVAIEAQPADQDGNGPPTALVLDEPLPQACFPHGLAYRLRAGDVFLAGALEASGRIKPEGMMRLGRGDTFGPGREAGLKVPLSFTLRDDLAVDAGLSACQRYADGIRPGAGQPPWRSRQGYTAFALDDPAAALQLASAYDRAGRPQRHVGTLPFGLLVTPKQSPGGQRLWVSFAGGNGLWTAELGDSRNFTTDLSGQRSRLMGL